MSVPNNLTRSDSYRLGRLDQIAILLLLCILAGCSPKTQTRTWSLNTAVRDTWGSKESSPEDCVEIVNKLIAPGTGRESIEELLGPGGKWVHFHGPSLTYLHGDTNPPADTGYFESWQLQYSVKGKLVILLFKPYFDRPQPAFGFTTAVLGTSGQATVTSLAGKGVVTGKGVKPTGKGVTH